MWVIAINPIAGGGRGEVLGRKVISYFRERDLTYKVFDCDSATQLRDSLLEEFATGDSVDAISSYQGVISVGGDGLAHLILQIVTPLQIPFTVIPAGTGNDFARAFGWELKSIHAQLDRVTNTPPINVDLGLVQEIAIELGEQRQEWFGAILSTGFDSIVNERANKMKWPKGPMKYNLAIALELPRFKPQDYKIELDNETLQVQAMLIAVANGKYYGGGMLVCPDASMKDGLFDIMVLLPVSKFEFLKVFPKVFKGLHILHPQVRMYRSSQVRISSPAIAYADGERIAQLPVQGRCIAGAGLSWYP